MSIETELKEIKDMITALNKKINTLIEEREVYAMIKLSEQSLQAFLQQEPDLYTAQDVKKGR